MGNGKHCRSRHSSCHIDTDKRTAAIDMQKYASEAIKPKHVEQQMQHVRLSRPAWAL